MASHELNVFSIHYAMLCDTLTDINNLLPHFVGENVINIDTLEEINATIPATTKFKVQKLMTHISGPLTAGNTKVFYTMLRIMEKYGHQATQQLANQMKKSLLATSDQDRNTKHRK